MRRAWRGRECSHGPHGHERGSTARDSGASTCSFNTTHGRFLDGNVVTWRGCEWRAAPVAVPPQVARPCRAPGHRATQLLERGANPTTYQEEARLLEHALLAYAAVHYQPLPFVTHVIQNGLLTL